MVLDLDQLRTLVAFADTGSCRAAAQRVHKTPSAVSVHLGKLAGTVERRLLARQGRRLVLTHDGNELVRYGRRLLALQDEALARFHRRAWPASLRVGLPDDYIPLVAPLLARLSDIAPGTHLELHCAPSAELRPLLARGALDVAILSAETDTQEGLVLRREPVVWAASAQQDWSRHAELPLALFPEGCIFRKWALAQLRHRGREHRIVCTSRNMPAIQAAVRAGFAVALMAESCLPEGAVGLTAEQGFEPLPPVTIILAAGAEVDPSLVRQLAAPMRSDLQRLSA